MDSSAIYAILLRESDALRFDAAIRVCEPVMSLATRVEVSCVARRRLGPAGEAEITGLLDDYGTSFLPFDAHQAALAIEAMDRFGVGRGSPPAVLNVGDLFSYALAKVRDVPLLYKGSDFARTDIRSALVELGL